MLRPAGNNPGGTFSRRMSKISALKSQGSGSVAGLASFTMLYKRDKRKMQLDPLIFQSSLQKFHFSSKGNVCSKTNEVMIWSHTHTHTHQSGCTARMESNGTIFYVRFAARSAESQTHTSQLSGNAAEVKSDSDALPTLQSCLTETLREGRTGGGRERRELAESV